MCVESAGSWKVQNKKIRRLFCIPLSKGKILLTFCLMGGSTLFLKNRQAIFVSPDIDKINTQFRVFIEGESFRYFVH
ncbi:hypothetical protein GGU45_002675 [Niabella hirudinis]